MVKFATTIRILFVISIFIYLKISALGLISKGIRNYDKIKNFKFEKIICEV